MTQMTQKIAQDSSPKRPDTTLNAHGRQIARNAVQASYAHVLGRELDDRERAIVRRIAFVARLMDNAVQIPGTQYRVGLDPLLGLIPAYGDGVSCAVSLYVLIEAIRLGTPPTILLKMSANIGVDLVVGIIPGLGDVFDAFFKANARNAQLIHTDVLGLHAPKGQQPKWDEVLQLTKNAQSAPEAIEDATYTEENTQRPLSAEHTLAPRRERTLAQQTLGYSLVVGLVLLFLLPWVLVGYLILQ